MDAAGDMLEHWVVGTVADGSTAMLTTFASELIDGKSLEEAFNTTVNSADQIWENAALTSAFGTIADAMVAPKVLVAGTMVVTAAGLVAIENIQPGDMVLAANEETGEYAYKEVVRTFVNTTEEITHVTISNGEGVQEVIDSTHSILLCGRQGLGGSQRPARRHDSFGFANGTKGTVEDISNEGPGRTPSPSITSRSQISIPTSLARVACWCTIHVLKRAPHSRTCRMNNLLIRDSSVIRMAVSVIQQDILQAIPVHYLGALLLIPLKRVSQAKVMK